VASVDDFGGALAEHPLLPQAWAQKLCFYVSSSACDEADPELARVVARFVDSGYAWDVLVKELVTSPLTTRAAPTATAQENGEVIAVARRDHLCASIAARLGLADACSAPEIADIVSGLPSDGYGRGAVAPILPNDPTLFFRAAVENICASVAARVVDPASATPNARQWSSADPHAAIADFVGTLMALTPSDARAAPARDLLEAHYASALSQSGTSATDALRSTFIVACAAPSAISIGL